MKLLWRQTRFHFRYQLFDLSLFFYRQWQILPPQNLYLTSVEDRKVSFMAINTCSRSALPTLRRTLRMVLQLTLEPLLWPRFFMVFYEIKTIPVFGNKLNAQSMLNLALSKKVHVISMSCMSASSAWMNSRLRPGQASKTSCGICWWMTKVAGSIRRVRRQWHEDSEKTNTLC